MLPAIIVGDVHCDELEYDSQNATATTRALRAAPWSSVGLWQPEARSVMLSVPLAFEAFVVLDTVGAMKPLYNSNKL